MSIMKKRLEMREENLDLSMSYQRNFTYTFIYYVFLHSYFPPISSLPSFLGVYIVVGKSGNKQMDYKYHKVIKYYEQKWIG